MRIALILVDVVVTVCSLMLAAYLKFDSYMFLRDNVQAQLLMVCFVALVLLLGVVLGVYNTWSKYFGIRESFKQAIISFSVPVMGVGLYLVGVDVISLTMLVMFAFIYLLLSCGIHGHKRLMSYLKIRTKVEGASKDVLVIGAGESGAALVKHLKEYPDVGYRPIGFLDDDKHKKGMTVYGVKVVDEVKECKKHMLKHNIDTVVIAINAMTQAESDAIYQHIIQANPQVNILNFALSTTGNANDQVLKKVSIEDLLFREPIQTKTKKSAEMIEGKVVLVTGGAGSIGSEICRQILQNNCKQLIVCDINENGLYEINEEFKGAYLGKYITCLASVRDKSRLRAIFNEYHPEIVFHAGAHKHVPMMECNCFEAVKNNVLGTKNLAEEAVRSKCKKLVLISTDKAVNPTNVMGATKRMCELIVKSNRNTETEMVAVRFGNVLGSNGSVVPLFKRQIEAGGPVTVTSKDMIRYFMTIKEAVSLVLSAGALAHGSELFVLDMGSPVKISDLAENLIRLMGKVPHTEIKIVETGLRPGEKLYEEISLSSEEVDTTAHKKIFVIKDNSVDIQKLEDDIEMLRVLAEHEDDEQALRRVLFSAIQEGVAV